MLSSQNRAARIYVCRTLSAVGIPAVLRFEERTRYFAVLQASSTGH